MTHISTGKALTVCVFVCSDPDGCITMTTPPRQVRLTDGKFTTCMSQQMCFQEVVLESFYFKVHQIIIIISRLIMVEYFAVFQQYLFVPSCLLPVSYLKIHRRGFLTSADPFPPPPQVLDLASSAVSPPTAGNAGGSRTSTEPLQSCVASSPRTRPTGS